MPNHLEYDSKKYSLSLRLADQRGNWSEEVFEYLHFELEAKDYCKNVLRHVSGSRNMIISCLPAIYRSFLELFYCSILEHLFQKLKSQLNESISWEKMQYL